jgi:NADPH2:quinone reductase
MQAAWYNRLGEARDVLTVGELPTPVPGPGEVRVRLHTSGVNPSDVKSRRARAITDPFIVPHSDGAGFIDAVGAGVSPAREGERVWVWNGQWQRPMGTAAEFIVLPAQQAVLLPDHIDLAAGACLGIPALTALQALNLAGDVRDKQVLVVGAGSAVGHYATQIARLRGAHVIGTAGSTDKIAHARAAGAHEVINYKTEAVAERIKALTEQRGVDVIIDMDLSSTANIAAQGALARHGQLVCYGSNALEVALPFRQFLYASVQLKFFLVYDLLAQDRRDGLTRLSDLLEARALQHTIGPRFKLADIVQAHEAVEAGAFGNVVVDVAGV